MSDLTPKQVQQVIDVAELRSALGQRIMQVITDLLGQRQIRAAYTQQKQIPPPSLLNEQQIKDRVNRALKLRKKVADAYEMKTLEKLVEEIEKQNPKVDDKAKVETAKAPAPAPSKDSPIIKP